MHGTAQELEAVASGTHLYWTKSVPKEHPLSAMPPFHANGTTAVAVLPLSSTSEISALLDYDAHNAKQPSKQDYVLTCTEALLRMWINHNVEVDVDRTKPGGAHSAHILHALKLHPTHTPCAMPC